LWKEDMGERRYDLDWVRIYAFMLLIVYHVGMYYVSWDWLVKSAQASSAVEPLMMLTAPARCRRLLSPASAADAGVHELRRLPCGVGVRLMRREEQSSADATQ
jgi:glucan biosynthesis protein C